MNGDRARTGLRVPTLTEVVAVADSHMVDLPLDDALADAAFPAALQAQPDPGPETLPQPPQQAAWPADTGGRPAPAEPVDEIQLVQQVLADVQRQVELLLEYRLRETLAPILARATDSLIRDTRSQLAATLHEMVARAVAQELSRHRDR
jgi:hypothetical protein